MRLVVLVSGTGTILEAIIGAGIPVALVVSDRSCPAIEQAETAGVEAAIVARENFGAHFDRHAYTVRLTSLLEEAAIALVAMAGFGTILAAPSTTVTPAGSSIPTRHSYPPSPAGTPSRTPWLTG